MTVDSHHRIRRRESLTPRQEEVVALIDHGCTNGEIADRLGISLDGAKWHVSEIITKLGVESRDEAVQAWRADRAIGRRVARRVQAFVAPLVAYKLVIAATAGVVVAVATGGLVIGLLRSGDPSTHLATLATVTAQGSPYDPGKVFVATDVFDLSLLPRVSTGDWQQSGSLNKAFSLAVPKDWTVSAGETSISANKPLLPGQTVAICKTVPGWSKVDLSADATPLQELLPDANVVREVFYVLPSNGMTVEILQVSGSAQCGPDYGVLTILPQPASTGPLLLNGSAWVQFPATADDIARIFAVVGSVKLASGSSAATPAPTGEIGVTQNSRTTGSYATMDQAIAAASQLAGFQVLPVLNLPTGFTVSFFNVLAPQVDPNSPIKPDPNAFKLVQVQVGVRSDSGGLLITEINTNMQMDGAPTATPNGNFYDSGPGDSRSFTLVTANRTFGIGTRSNLTPAQALAILNAFH